MNAFLELEREMSLQVDELEAELKQLQQSASARSARENPRATAAAIAPYWEQVLVFMRQGQEEEAIYALIRVVQRILDEKALKPALADKASKAYVDSLFERVSSGVKENLVASMNESARGLDARIAEVRDKISDLRNYVQSQLQEIQTEMDKLKCQTRHTVGDGGEAAVERDGPGFTVHPHRRPV
jgi:hypothetical protein